MHAENRPQIANLFVRLIEKSALRLRRTCDWRPRLFRAALSWTSSTDLVPSSSSATAQRLAPVRSAMTASLDLFARSPRSAPHAVVAGAGCALGDGARLRTGRLETVYLGIGLVEIVRSPF